MLFFDIETAPAAASLDGLTSDLQRVWRAHAEKQAARDGDAIDAADRFNREAGLLAEYGRVVSIALGKLERDGDAGEQKLSVCGFASQDERQLLATFARACDGRDPCCLVGHHIKGFDMPFLGRRMLIHGMRLPRALDIRGAKPWEIPHLDTMELWRFGDRAWVKLDVLAAAFGLPSSKSDLDGSQVRDAYWNDGDLERIARYCAADVATTAQVFRRLMRLDAVKGESIDCSTKLL